MSKTAIILFNLGGPGTLDDVRPFLFNLFKDKAIINLPFFLRFPLAKLISGKREAEARHIYAAIGGGSPLLANTKAQASALQEIVGDDYKVFISMRYWHPMAAEVAQEVAAYQPDTIIYLPLYPHYSTTTTQSSFDDFDKALGTIRSAPHLKMVRNRPGELGRVPSRIGEVKKICCYPREAGLVQSYAELIRPIYEEAVTSSGAHPRILFSAHGLPEKTIKAGDPYQWQVEEVTHAVVAALNIPHLDVVNCYQSRVGPLKWIGPYTDEEIIRAGKEKKSVVVVPIAFVSEHSETLYELDQQYRDLAHEHGVPFFGRVPTPSTHPAFIAGLARLVREAQAHQKACAPDGGVRLCPSACRACPCR